MTVDICSIPKASDTVILIDERNRGPGAADKLETHRRSRLHRAFSVFLTVPDSRFFCSADALGKDHADGPWANGCCGHAWPASGQRRAPAAVGEEFGVDCRPRFAFFGPTTPPLITA